MKEIINQVIEENRKVLSRVNIKDIENLAKKVLNAKRIFITGTGRSGLIGKVFAMRLMHSGYNVFVTGETITPSITENDLLIVVSGSGSTRSLNEFAVKAREIGADSALITTNGESPIGKISEHVVVIPAATKNRLPGEPETIQPLGSQFDQAAHLLLDALVIYLLNNQSNKQGSAELNQTHANLE